MTDITLDPSKGQTLEKWAKAIPSDAGIVRLAPGEHGRPLFTGRLKQTVQIVGPASGPPAIVRAATFRDTARWLFRRILFQAAGVVGPNNFQAVVDTDTLSSDLTFGSTSKAYGCAFKACDDIGVLSVADRLALPHTLVRLRGRNMVVAFSRLHDCRNAIALLGPNCRAEDNIIERFTVDGIDMGGSGQRVLRNLIRDGRHFPEELLHADAIQHLDVAANDSIVADNIIEPSPFADYLQGITGFDGHWSGVQVLRNKVAPCNAYHGITLMGADGVTIEDNTVTHDGSKVVPWIQVTASKDGRASTAVTCRGNTAPRMLIDRPASLSANTLA
ncbi:hypothetical protein [Rhizobium sp. Leaf383]|uniref:hypothetical protein n=1 Tax=Rhizobium sp. Leaf383 TaxID=1736357 RepID=UPI000714C875|nr:hypothetical protein [Rhizobium sp. Leaf383]KQS86924.1 hypothetical protein ASG58_01360 [Rhizobium sp. Leaf383]